MNAQTESAASDATEQTELESEATEQVIESTGSSFQDELLKTARESGHTIGDEPPKEEAEPETESPEGITEVTEPETEPDAEGVPEGKDAEEPVKEEKPERKSIAEQIADAKAKGEKPAWYLTRIAEEAEKKRTANERAEKAEAKVRETEAKLAQSMRPIPTEDDPFLDIQKSSDLDILEKSYEKTIELAVLNPEGLVEQIVEQSKKRSGKDPLEEHTPEQLVEITKRKAEFALKRQIPDRRKYLDKRAQEDANAFEAYPQLRDDPEFSGMAQELVYRLLTGQSQREPDILIWVADAIAGRNARLAKANGEVKPAKTPEVTKIIESRKTKVAPTPTRTRSFPERRGTSSVNLEKANQKLESTGTREAAEEVLNAMWAGKGGSPKRVESVAD